MFLWKIFGVKDGDYVIKYGDKFDSYFKPKCYNTETPDSKILTITSSNIQSAISFKRMLEALEERRFIEPRNEEVSGCDYWSGFFGTSNNLWYGSVYHRANPAERVKQLAYGLENGIRNSNWSWYFPGPINIGKTLTKPQEKIVRDINKFFESNSKISPATKPYVISELRKYANLYEQTL